MDDLDQKIFQLLQENGRASYARIAKDVGVSAGTVRHRVQSLIQDEIIRVVAVPDLEKMGYSTVALVGVQADPDKVDSVAERLVQLPEAYYVSLTTGTYDILILAAVSSLQELRGFLSQKVGIIPGVQRTETSIQVAIVKHGYPIFL